MPELPLEFEVFCAKCGAGLCNNCTEGRTPRRNVPYIRIEPCEKCLEKAREEGYTKGYDDGREDEIKGREEGRDEIFTNR